MTRPFRSIPAQRGPDEEYDVVVIGGGVGGLVAACLLAKSGLRVLLAEQHYMLGGYCSTFKRCGFVFDASTHFYPLLGNPQTITGRLLADIGSTTQWKRMDPVDRFHFPDGTTFDVPAEFDKYVAALHHEFPTERANIDRFFGTVQEAYLHGILHYFRGVTSGWVRRREHLNVREVLDEHFESTRLKLLLTADCPHWGSPPSRTSFVFDSMLRASYFLGNYYPVGGSQVFVDDFGGCFERMGGHVALRTMAERIHTRCGQVEGVTLRWPHRGETRSRRVRARAVISNADITLTLKRLLDDRSAAAETLELISGLRPTSPCFLSHFGVSGIDREVLARAHGYHWRHWDSDQCGGSALRFKVFVPTLYEPGMAPRGSHVVIIQKMLDVDFDAMDDWSEHKRGVESEILEHLDRIIPGFADHVVVGLSATAQTSARFTLNRFGAMLGWEMSPEQLGENRPGVRGPVGGLYFAGHWVQPGGGITPVMVSGMNAARAVREDLGQVGLPRRVVSEAIA